jgi:hypothetical protein
MFPGHVEISRIERRIQTEVFQKRVLKKILESMNDEVTGEDYIKRSFVVCILHRMLFEQIKKNEMGRACRMCGDRRCLYRVLVGNLRERDNLERLD